MCSLAETSLSEACINPTSTDAPIVGYVIVGS